MRLVPVLPALIGLLAAGCALTATEEARQETDETARQISELEPIPVPSPFTVLRLDDERPYTGLAILDRDHHELLPTFWRADDAVTVPLSGRQGDTELATRIEASTGLAVRLIGSPLAPGGSGGTEVGSSAAAPIMPADQLLPDGGIWTGPLDELLDRWTTIRGYAWRYDPPESRLDIIRRQVVVFRLNALAGSQAVSGQTSTSGSGGDNTATGLAQQSIVTQTSYDPWPEIAAQLGGIIPAARITPAPATAAVSVAGLPRDIDRAREYFTWLNETVLRPITLTVDVYAVEYSDNRNFDLGIAGTLERLFGTDIGLDVTGDTITVVKPPPSGDSLDATVNALHEIGTVSRVLSASVPSLNAQPAQFYELFNEAYLAEISTTFTESGPTTNLVPATIASGFAMTYIAQLTAPGEVLVRLFASIQDRPAFEVFESNSARIQLPAFGARAVQVTQSIERGETLVVTGFRDRSAIGNRSGTIHALFPFPAGGARADAARTEQVLLITADVGAPLGITETAGAEL